MRLFCIDIGNTHTHYAIVGPEGTTGQAVVPTRKIDDPQEGIASAYWRLVAQHGSVRGIAFSSVVPAATPLLKRAFERQNTAIPLFHLTHEVNLGIGIDYPNPSEIGQDRLANAAAAHALHGSPAIVIDLGTAVTFDLVMAKGGYVGGIIAPGVGLMRHYLHEKTAQLPLLEGPLSYSSPIGRSTIEAMQIGAVLGFSGMIQSMLNAVVEEYARRGEHHPAIIATGGTAELIIDRLSPRPILAPDLTLQGLAVAFALNQGK